MTTTAGLLTLLTEAGDTLSTAESLTAGMLASRLADVPGASRCLRGGVVAYATDIKRSVLRVPYDVVATHGVVSAQCAAAMALAVRELMGSTWALSTTGVAGPDRQEEHPPGTVWIAAAGSSGVTTQLLALHGSRSAIREATCDEAVSLLAGMLRREHGGLR